MNLSTSGTVSITGIKKGRISPAFSLNLVCVPAHFMQGQAQAFPEYYPEIFAPDQSHANQPHEHVRDL